MTVSKSRRTLLTGRVTASQALRVARSFGVALDLSNDLELAGKWKHGWVPLDAVAAAVKAKRYHGGATHEVSTYSGPVHVRNVRDDANNKNMAVATVVKDHRKGTVGSHSPGESVWVAKAQVRPLGAGEGHTVRGKARSGSLVESMRRPSVGRSKASPPRRQEKSPARWVSANNGSGKRMHFLISSDESLPVSQRYHYGSNGNLVRFSSHEAAQKAADRLHKQGQFPGVAPSSRRARVEATGKRLAEQARERNATRPQPKVSELSDGDLRQLINVYGIRSPQADAARAELSRREHTGSKSRIQIRPAVYRGESGHIISGTHGNGRRAKVFHPGTRAEAEQVKANIKAGREPFHGMKRK